MIFVNLLTQYNSYNFDLDYLGNAVVFYCTVQRVLLHWGLRCRGKFDPLGSHPTDPRTKYRSYFPADVLPA
ncbi:MAG: hypothetical protein ACREE6_04355 [Limisphaerales bacterium]